MTFQLNGENGHPACVDMLGDSGSIMHLLLGALAGSDWFTGKDSIMLLAAFAGYQLSQAHSGEPFSRIGGELMEFALGMLLARFGPGVISELGRIDARTGYID
jgi:hypothetical protein